jgi:hypothetical protein
MGAVIAGGASVGITVAGGDLFVRDVTVSPSADVGIVAQSGSTLRLERVKVQNNMKGGILLDGASFEFKSVLVRDNGPGQLGLAAWGGILVNGNLVGRLASLQRVSIVDNKGPGLLCAQAVQGAGVLATGNSTTDVTPMCAISTCSAGTPACGADLQP